MPSVAVFCHEKGTAMTEGPKEICCPPFNPASWDDQEIRWEDKLFVKDRVRSFFRVPLNFGAVMRRDMALIEEADAAPRERLVLADENSLWGADVYLAVNQDVPGATMATISGTFITKVFEGPFQDVRKWIAQMVEFVQGKGHAVEKLYFYYTTCPKCAKKYGKNYVVLLAKVW